MADAHLTTTGLGLIDDGILHVLVSVEDLVPVIAMAMLAGLQGPVAGRRALFALTGAWLAGGVAGFLLSLSPAPASGVAAISFFALGALMVSDFRLAPVLVVALAMTLGVLHGSLNGSAIAEAQREVLELAGIASAVFVLVALAAALVVSLQSTWMRLAVRVMGSWVAATGILMLALVVRGM